ncbi:hypothetical protein BJV78DRAFT_1157618 [Lactifluus subvellereus]|nr:hypothetical protein BJV78DRAFT_1157618 [Lactifluus subvellereus]
MAALHTAPDFAFLSWADGLLAEEDHTTLWSETAGYVQPAPELDFFLGGPNIDTVAGFGNPPNGGESLANIDIINATALASGPSPHIYLDDLKNHMHAVSTQRLIVH